MTCSHLQVSPHEALRTLLSNVVGDNIEPSEPVKLDQVRQLTSPSCRRSGRAWGVRRCVESIEADLPNKR